MECSKFKTAVLVLGVMMITGLSYGQSENRQKRKAPPTFQELLKEMDENEDGKLSKEELKGPLKENFTEVDLDEDGFISEEEFKKAPKPKRRERNN